MDKIEVMKQQAGFFEIYHKTSFWGYRRNADGKEYEVLVDIFDTGLEAGNLQYSCVATAKDGKMATGNPASSIDLALSLVHWYDLDK